MPSMRRVQVLEVGPVGWAADVSEPRLYVHSQRSGDFGNASRLVATALQAASSAQVRSASAKCSAVLRAVWAVMIGQLYSARLLHLGV